MSVSEGTHGETSLANTVRTSAKPAEEIPMIATLPERDQKSVVRLIHSLAAATAMRGRST